MEKAPGFESAKALVVQYLETYNDRARKIALLRYELGHVAQVSPNEMIDAMSFSHGDFSCMTPHTTKPDKFFCFFIIAENAGRTTSLRRYDRTLFCIEQMTSHFNGYSTIFFVLSKRTNASSFVSSIFILHLLFPQP